MLNKTQLIEKLNFHFPSYGAVDGSKFASGVEHSILFEGENAAANFMANDTGEGTCPVSVFLDRHGWYIEHHDELTAFAYRCPKALEKENTFDGWDKLVEKSKTERLTEDEKNELRMLQKKMLELS